MVIRVSLQHTQRQGYEDLRGREGENFICFIQGCDLHLSLVPADALSTRIEFNRDIRFVQLPAEDFYQSLISPFHPERAISVDLFVSVYATHQGMNTDQGRIGGVETFDITSRPGLGVLKFRIVIRIRAAALEKLLEGLIGSAVIQLLKDLINLGEEITRTQLPFLDTPLFSLQLSCPEVMLSQQGPYFRRPAVDKFGAKFDWDMADGIMLGKDAAAYAVTGFQDRNFESGLGKFHRG